MIMRTRTRLTHVKILHTSSLSAPPSASFWLCFFADQLVFESDCIPPVLDELLTAVPFGWTVDVAAAV
jgi:hypothetical protein